MAVTHSFFNIMVSVIPLDKNVGCELHKEVELKAYRKIYVALRAVYYFPFIKNNPVDQSARSAFNFVKVLWQLYL